MRIAALTSLLALTTSACGGDALRACSYEAQLFDIEDVSTLEDAALFPQMADAVVLESGVAATPDGATWRVAKVEVLVMVAESNFPYLTGDYELAVQIFEGDDPTRAEEYTVWQTLDPDALDWDTYELDDPTEASERRQKGAWWSFDFTGVIPAEGMQSPYIVAGVKWPGVLSAVSVGYSNYNRPCHKNWTDYGSGFEQNQAGESDDLGCNWPMLRIGSEVTDPTGGSCTPP